jgi:hypothetical protein
MFIIAMVKDEEEKVWVGGVWGMDKCCKQWPNNVQ